MSLKSDQDTVFFAGIFLSFPPLPPTMTAFTIHLMAPMVGLTEPISPVVIVKLLRSMFRSVKPIVLASFLNNFLLPILSCIHFSYLRLSRLPYHQSLLLLCWILTLVATSLVHAIDDLYFSVTLT